MLLRDDAGLSDLTDPVLIVALEGWVSAGSAGVTTADHIAADADTVVHFDSDVLYDYRVNRPLAGFRDGVLGSVGWPELRIRRHRGERDLLILSGPEPDWNWKRLAAEIGGLAADLGVVAQLSLGGIPWAAPHTRPTVVTTTASRSELLGPDANEMEGTLEVPAAAALVLERALADRGIDTVGLWARVPHYVGGTYYPAAVTLLERVARRTGVVLDPGVLVDEAAEQRRRLDETTETQPQVQSLVHRYEELYDSGSELASGEEIAADFERFLREQSGNGDAPGGL